MGHKDTFFSRKLTINCRGELIDLTKPKVMGILNLTPDSFYDGGVNSSGESAMLHVEKMLAEGCDMVDIGAYSSRPGAKDVSLEEELSRLAKLLELIRKRYPDLIISVDTFRAEVAKTVVKDYEVDIINDISAGEIDPGMFNVIAELKVPYIMMHMQGTPATMQNKPQYDNVVKEIIQFFSEKIEKLKLLGLNDIIIDPGFGFGKTLEQNYLLLKYLNDFKILGLPILSGISRKSFIYKLLDITPKEALNGTTVLNTLSVTGGANILRVHDVKEARETIALTSKFLNAKLDNWYD